MSTFKAAHAIAEDWAHVAQACVDGLGRLPDGANLGFIYATDELAEDFQSLLAYLRDHTGIDDWVGSLASSICAGVELHDRAAAAVAVAALPEGAFKVFRTIGHDTGELAAPVRAWIDETQPFFGLVHADPSNPDVPDLIEKVAGLSDAFLVGGIVSSRHGTAQAAGRITGGGLSGVLFAPGVEVVTGLSQGCTPLGPTHVVSDCLENVIVGLDGHKALDVFKKDVGELYAYDLSRTAGVIHLALPIEGSDTNDYLVRPLTGIDKGRGWLAGGCECAPGSRVMFVRRDPQTALADLDAMARRLAERAGGRAKGGIYVSCVARGRNMFGDAESELAVLREALGPEVPVIGFHSGGEICHNRLYGFTGVLTLFL